VASPLNDPTLAPDRDPSSHRRFAALLAATALAVRWIARGGVLDEVDSGLLLAAVRHGLDVVQRHPQPPGMPVYVLAASAIARVTGDAVQALELTSLAAGVAAPLLFWRLLARWTDERQARAGAWLLVFSPLAVLYSTSGLADELGLAMVLLLALATSAARDSRAAALGLLPAWSLAVGVRPQNLALAPLVAFGLVEAWRAAAADRRRGLRALALGALLALAATGLWLVPLIRGSGGLAAYERATREQVACCIAPTSVFGSAPADARTLAFRWTRFAAGYFRDASLAPEPHPRALAGFARSIAVVAWVAWLVTARAQRRDLFLALWLGCAAAPILGIHFLARYALPFLPASLMAMFFGLDGAGAWIFAPSVHLRRRVCLALAIAGGAIAIVGFFSRQPPVATFELGVDYRDLHLRPLGLWLLAAAICVLVGRWAVARASAERPPAAAGERARAVRRLPAIVLLTASALELAAAASPRLGRACPSARVVEAARTRFAADRPLLCGGPDSWAFVAEAFPAEQVSRPVRGLAAQADELLAAAAAGRLVLLTDCWSIPELRSRGARFAPLTAVEGRSFLWAKGPRATLARLLPADPPRESARARAPEPVETRGLRRAPPRERRGSQGLRRPEARPRNARRGAVRPRPIR
jgi:hypothetical protein